MSKIRVLHLSLMVALVATVSQPVKALASTGLTTYPSGKSVGATFEQTTKHKFTFTDHLPENGFWTFECTKVTYTALGIVKAGDTAITVHPSYQGCVLFGLELSINTSNCDYIYRFGEPTAAGWHVTTDISCSEGSSIKLTTANCELTIGPQTGATTSEATNTGTASPETGMDLLIHTNLTNLKYVVTKDAPGCLLSGTGSFSKGDYSGTDTIKAHDVLTGAATGLTVGPPPPPPGLVATGEQVGENSLQLTDHLISGQPATAKCKTLKLTGPEPVASLETTITAHPEYTGCIAFGLNATITTAGCDYVFHVNAPTSSGRAVSTDLSCGSGAMKVNAGTCEVTIGSQTGLATSEMTNSGTAGAMDLLLHTSLSGIKYTVVKDGIACPLSGTGSFTKGDYVGTTTFQAHDSITKAAASLTMKPVLLIATGEQSGENTVQLTDHLIGGEPASIKCKAMTLTGTKAMEAVKEELRVHPEYKECTAFGAAATVTTTNCDYLFHIGSATAGGWHTATDVVCSGGSTIKVVSGNCEVTLQAQTGLTTSELTNSGTEAEMDLLLHTSITGIHYTVVKDGTGCPLSGTGEFSQGDYTGKTTIKAHDSETLKPTGITKT